MLTLKNNSQLYIFICVEYLNYYKLITISEYYLMLKFIFHLNN